MKSHLCRILFICVALLSPEIKSLAQPDPFIDTAAMYFKEAKKTTADHISLWGIDIGGALLLVDPATRKTYASEADSGAVLVKQGTVYTGILPKQVNIANTSINWGGKKWAMVMLPLPKNFHNRQNLLSHELFHRSQAALGFFPFNPDNNHLDKKDGRIHFRLELEALKKAVYAGTEAERKEHLANALLFRQYRRSLYPGSDSTENTMELNEGICEYTGVMMSGRDPEAMKAHFQENIQRFVTSVTYVRSFPYEAIPVYGYILSQTDKDWNKKINGKTDLTAFFKQAFAVKLPIDLKTRVAEIAGDYHGNAISKEELDREQRIARQLAAYRRIFIDSPHVELPLVKMNMSFDYTRIVPLDGKGTVYPQIRITDVWGILEVEKGALISADWRKVSMGFPESIEGGLVKGDGWKLELKEGYVLENDISGKGYKLKNPAQGN